MVAFFNNINETGVALGAKNRSGGNFEPILRVGSEEQIKRSEELQNKITQLTAAVTKADKNLAKAQSEWEKNKQLHSKTPADIQKIIATASKKQMTLLDQSTPITMVMEELPKPRPAYVLNRGQYTDKGEEVTAATPAMLPPLPDNVPRNRLALARWIVSPQNPLTARVWVNRQWERFFGNGIVRSSENFGLQSEPPSHPELIDWLATEFVSCGWNMKAMQIDVIRTAGKGSVQSPAGTRATIAPACRINP
jgi:hypothetical protein